MSAGARVVAGRWNQVLADRNKRVAGRKQASEPAFSSVLGSNLPGSSCQILELHKQNQKLPMQHENELQKCKRNKEKN